MYQIDIYKNENKYAQGMEPQYLETLSDDSSAEIVVLP
jgi:hypothetical protein